MKMILLLFKISATMQAESPAQSIAVALVQAAHWLKKSATPLFQKPPLCSGSLALQIS